MIVVLSIITDPPFQPECANCQSKAVQFWTNAEINPRREGERQEASRLISNVNANEPKSQGGRLEQKCGPSFPHGVTKVLNGIANFASRFA
jgi:hypothetical protein